MPFCGTYSGATDVQVIDVDLPITVVVKIVQTDPGFKGDTAQGTLSAFSFGTYLSGGPGSATRRHHTFMTVIVVLKLVCLKIYKSVGLDLYKLTKIVIRVVFILEAFSRHQLNFELLIHDLNNDWSGMWIAHLTITDWLIRHVVTLTWDSFVTDFKEVGTCKHSDRSNLQNKIEDDL